MSEFYGDRDIRQKRIERLIDEQFAIGGARKAIEVMRLGISSVQDVLNRLEETIPLQLKAPKGEVFSVRSRNPRDVTVGKIEQRVHNLELQLGQSHQVSVNPDESFLASRIMIVGTVVVAVAGEDFRVLDKEDDYWTLEPEPTENQ